MTSRKYQGKNPYRDSDTCVFCEIVAGRSPSHPIWEDEKHIAFLSIHPNTEGFAVVITKEHYPSYAFELPDDVLQGLTVASKMVGRLLDERLENVGRTGMIFEGYGVNHVHSKLFPMHGTAKLKKWRPLYSKIGKYFKEYEGYISSHDAMRVDDDQLEKLAKKIRGEA